MSSWSFPKHEEHIPLVDAALWASRCLFELRNYEALHTYAAFVPFLQELIKVQSQEKRVQSEVLMLLRSKPAWLWRALTKIQIAYFTLIHLSDGAAPRTLLPSSYHRLRTSKWVTAVVLYRRSAPTTSHRRAPLIRANRPSSGLQSASWPNKQTEKKRVDNGTFQRDVGVRVIQWREAEMRNAKI